MAGDQFLAIGGITIAVRSLDERLQWSWPAPMRRFVVAPQPADVTIDVAVAGDGGPASAGELLFDSGGIWSMYRDGEGYRLECRSENLGAVPYMVGRFDPSFTRGTILVDPGIVHLNLSPLDYPIDEVLIAHLLGRGRGVELHSCGVIDRNGLGHLFVGVSGAGKSTTAHLWEGSSLGVISDDRVIVREHGGEMWMYGTPWHGEADLSLPERARLAGVYLLVQSAKSEIRDIEDASAVARLLRCAFPPFYDERCVDYTLTMLESLVRTVPVRELNFTLDGGVVDLVLGSAA